MNPTNSSDAGYSDSKDAGNKLLLSLYTTFSVIVLGYVLARNRALPSATDGLAPFIGKISLPALVFISIATLDFNTVDWRVVGSIAFGKTIVFAVVATVSLFTLRSEDNRLSVAGIRAITATQSNDFAIGLPLLSALYPSNYIRYLYIAAPVSFLWLNLIGFVMMSLGNAATGDKDTVSRNARSPMWVGVLLSVATNPVVFMTFLGLIANFSFSHTPPPVLTLPAQLLGNAFSGSALLTLGMSMSGRLSVLRGRQLLPASLLVVAKCVLLPIVMRAAARAFGVSEHGGLFLFLYSMIPSAPGALAFAIQYRVTQSQIAAAIVLCTIVSAPIMFVSAKMKTIQASPDAANSSINVIGQTAFAVSAGGALIVFLLYFLLRRLLVRVVDRTILMIGFSCFIYSISATFCAESQSPPTLEVLRALAYYWGRGMTVWWLVAYALVSDAELFCKQSRMKKLSQWSMWVLSATVPFLVACVVIFLPGSQQGKRHINCFLSGGMTFGDIYIKIILPLICLPALAYALGKRTMYNASLTSDGEPDESTRLLSTVTREPSDVVTEVASSTEHVQASAHGPNLQLHATDFRHTVYLTLEILLQTLIIIDWTFSTIVPEGSTPQLEIRFLDVTFHASRGIFLFLIFASREDVWGPFWRRMESTLAQIRRRRHLPAVTDAGIQGWVHIPSTETAASVKTEEWADKLRIVIPALQRDRDIIEADKTDHIFGEIYKNAFSGSDLVDWILLQEAAVDRLDAVVLGKMLLAANAIMHVTHVPFFVDSDAEIYRLGRSGILLAN